MLRNLCVLCVLCLLAACSSVQNTTEAMTGSTIYIPMVVVTVGKHKERKPIDTCYCECSCTDFYKYTNLYNPCEEKNAVE